MNEKLQLAMRRAVWAKDAPRQHPRYAPPPPPKPQILAPPSPPRMERVPWFAPRVELIGVERDRIGIIQHAVAAAYGVTREGLLGPRRGNGIVRPRHIAIYLTSLLLENLSMPQIGRRFGNRDHTSILHAIRKVEERRLDLEFERQLQQLMTLVREKLNG